MEFADQRRQHMAAVQVVVVMRAVQVGRHGADKARAVLALVGFAQLQARDLGDGVRLVGGFQRAGQQSVLAQRLRSLAGVDA
ncbi:hypothetical protein G6F31_020095 [Rhizopus arrhizus]|nr:hypothetical protein G6F31_020095 [Rhizopus arrhizus]